MATENPEFKSMDIIEKKEIIRNLRIYHPRFKTALELIKRCHESKQISTDPQCMLITGDSGSGKTTVFESYIKFHHKVIHGNTRTKRVILSAEIPSPTKISTFLEAMLNRLGDPFPTRGTIGNKNHRLVNLIKDCGIELIMLDEFQHFVNSENHKVNYDVSDCFKSIINLTKVPVILFGLEAADTVLECNPQLKRRFSVRYSMPPFRNDDDSSKKEFLGLLSLLDKKLPFDNECGLGSSTMASRIMAATEGNMNSIIKLVKEAALYALEQDNSQIENSDFYKAYQLHSYILKNEGKNPFS